MPHFFLQAPYRPLFLLGLGYAVAGTLLWPLAAMGVVPYPGIAHRILMIEGFEQSFVAGFMLTALGGLTHGGRSTDREVALSVLAQLGVGAAVLMGSAALAHGFFFASVLVLVVAAASRSGRGKSPGRPPRELILVLTALALGSAGGALLIVASLGVGARLLPLGLHLVSFGHVLTLVVGVGSMLVPTFLGLRNPKLTLRPSTSPRDRAWFYPVLAVLIAGSFGLEAAGQLRLAFLVRAMGASAAVLGVWRIHKSGPGGRLGLWLRLAGLAVLLGLWTVVVFPDRPLLGEHLVFIGGYGLLTMAVATRVVVSHGRWPATDEPRVLHPVMLACFGGALALRLLAEWPVGLPGKLWALSGSLWLIPWLVWSARAIPRMLRPGA